MDSNKDGSLMIPKSYQDENLAMIKLSPHQIEYSLVIKENNLVNFCCQLLSLYYYITFLLISAKEKNGQKQVKKKAFKINANN